MKKYTPSERIRRVARANLKAVPTGSRYNATRVLLAIANYADQETLTTNVGFSKIAEDNPWST